MTNVIQSGAPNNGPGEIAERPSRRVVVTGIGMVCALGTDTREVWEGAKAGRSGIGPITLFDAGSHATRFAGEVKDFDPLQYIQRKDVKKMGRFIHLAIAAADNALRQSGLAITPENAERVGVAIGSGIGGFEVIEREHKTLIEKGPGRVSPFFIPATLANLAAGWVSIRAGAKGPNTATATACTSSAHTIGEAFRLIQRGDADAMIAGGSEASITPMGIGGFNAMRALSTRNDAPDRASRPWDADRDGFVVGEGSGVLVMESLEFARRRGATVLAEIVGYGMSGDAHHMTAPPEDGEGAYRAMWTALEDAGLAPTDIGYLNAHATSTSLGDRAEALAIVRLFGDHATSKRLKVSSTKSMTGHLLGGAGGLEAGLTVCALADQTAPPTINLDKQDEDLALDFVPNIAQPLACQYALSNSFGFGGTNASLIFRREA
jgi:3-oxoacyl-[acyl-carrier-protein] synthase II